MFPALAIGKIPSDTNDCWLSLYTFSGSAVWPNFTQKNERPTIRILHLCECNEVAEQWTSEVPECYPQVYSDAPFPIVENVQQFE